MTNEHEVAAACNRINRCTKTLGMTRGYIRKCLIGKDDIAQFIYQGGAVGDRGQYGWHESVVIDRMAEEYGVSLGAAWQMEEWQKARGFELRETYCRCAFDDELDFDDLWENSEVRSSRGIEYSEAVLKSLAEMIRGDTDRLYAVKNCVLRVAKVKGKLVFEDPKRTDNGWVYSCSWENMRFHFPVSEEDGMLFDIQYEGEMQDHRFVGNALKRHSEFSRKEILKDVWLLKEYISQKQ